MTITSGFFRSVGGDRKYTAEFFTSYFASFIANGVFPNPSDNLQVLQFQNMQTIVRPGKAWINGNYMINDADFTIQHTISNGTFPRIDRIVVGLNFDTRDMTLYLKTGTAAASPVAPALTRNATLYEIALADVLIPQGSTQISQSNITDTRLNTQLCGIVHGLVEQVDTTTLYNQYLQAFNNFTDARQSEFDAFFEDLQATLDGNVAANLLDRIQRIENIRELNQFNLLDGTKEFSGSWLNTGSWAFSNENYKNLTVRSTSSSFLGLSKIVFLEVGTYNFSFYVRSQTDRGYGIFTLGAGITEPAIIQAPTNQQFNGHSDWRLINFTFNVTQSGNVRCRVEANNNGSGLLYVAGYNLYKGNYRKDWFPSENDIVNGPYYYSSYNLSEDLNSLRTPGSYYYPGTSNVSNKPPGVNNSAYYIDVDVSAQGIPFQMFRQINTGRFFTRSALTNLIADGYSPWREHGLAISSQQQALNGTDDNTIMTPLKVKNVADTKLNLSGGTLTGNLIIEKGIPAITLRNPDNGNVNFGVRLNASSNNDFGAQLIKNGNVAVDIISQNEVRFNHNSLGTFTVQDAFDKLQAQATTPTTPIANGKFIGVYE